MSGGDDMPAIVLVCVLCGAQRELPTLDEMIGAGRDGWLHCTPPCKSVKFSVRLRTPMMQREPAP